METIIDRVVAAAGRYEGGGHGVEVGAFTAAIELRSLLAGMGAEIVYTATGADGAVLHTEHTLLAFDMWSGEPTLYVLSPQLSGLGELALVGASTFSNGVGLDGLQLQIDLQIDRDVTGDTLQYVWSRGTPGEELAELSRATMTRV